ncbi:MAG: hypothetical protein ACM31O_03635 [Bacteroidota bacterium]
MPDKRLDDLINHRIGLERYGSSVLRQLIPELENAERDVIDIIQNRLFMNGPISISEVRRLETTLAVLRKAQVEAHEALFNSLRRELGGVAEHEGDFARQYYTDAFTIRAASLSVPSASTLVAAAMERPLSGRTLEAWTKKFTADQVAGVEQQIRLGIMEGESIGQIVNRLRGTDAYRGRDGLFAKQHNSAEALVRTAVNHVSNAAHMSFLRQNGKVFGQYQWISVLDRRCLGPDTRVRTVMGWRRIIDVRAGDLVYGGTGALKPVRSRMVKRVQRAARVTLSNGEVVLCSLDHFFLRADQKWVEAQDLRPGDRLAGRQRVPGNLIFNRQPFDEVL